MKHIEDTHQEMLFAWAKHVRLNTLQHRFKVGAMLSDYMYAIPNGGKRNAREGARLKAQGVKAGIPDIHIPISSSDFYSLYIELKRPIVKGKAKPVVSSHQKNIMSLLLASGNACCVCYGFDHAKQIISKYLSHQLEQSDLYKEKNEIIS